MITNIYDEIPYPSLVYTDTHPERLATLATLFGMKPPPVANCRVLELGCGDGTNLIAIAQSLPQASFWGIDFSATQIATGQKTIEAIQLSNIILKQQDFNDLEESLGKFDYIIAHGIYSWVPKEMQDKILSIIQCHLAFNGIAYISYNIYPGWYMENIVRDMMMYHTQQLPKMSFQVNMMQTKGIIRFLANLRQAGDTAFDLLLQEKMQLLQTISDNCLYHDLLEKENHPVYFHQFVNHIVQYHLAYVTDIEFRHYLMLSFPPQVIEAMEELFQGDFFKKEQYMDFFYNRTLRRTLLCHQNVQVNHELDWKVLPSFYIAANLQTENSSINWQNQEPAPFKKTDGEVITIKHPLTKLAIKYLTNLYPYGISFEVLFKHVCQQLLPAIYCVEALVESTQLKDARKENVLINQSQDLSLLQDIFAQELLHLYCLEAIELNIDSPSFVTTLSTYPTASPLARFLASQKQQPIINLRCELISLSVIATALLPHLNGKNDSQALCPILRKIIKNKNIEHVKKHNLSTILEKTLLEIAQCALLVA